jgi:hypothetical protein
MPTWVFLKKLSDGSAITPQPLITEVGAGQYKWSYDAMLLGEASGQIDAGATVPNPVDRFIDVILTLDNTYIWLMAAMAFGKVSGAGSGTEIFLDAHDQVTQRVVSSADPVGNRTGVTTN